LVFDITDIRRRRWRRPRRLPQAVAGRQNDR
jgi:hypothetical protein